MLASLFALAQKHSSALQIIGIANTITPQSAYFSRKPDLRGGLSAIPSHLSNLTLLSRKIAAHMGDVRSLFEVLHGAIDLAVMQPPSSGKDTPPVTPDHVLAALKANAPSSKVAPAAQSTPAKCSTNSETVTKVRNLGLHARLVLLALVLASHHTEASLPLLSPLQKCPLRSPVRCSHSSPAPLPTTTQAGIDVSQLHTFYGAVLTRHGSDTFTPVLRSEFGDLTGVLETIGLISLVVHSVG
jgi:cell division control protein 6